MTEIITSELRESAWWKAAVKARAEGTPLPPFYDGAMHPGFYRTRLARRGVYVAARIWTVDHRFPDGEPAADEELHIEVGGELIPDPWSAWDQVKFWEPIPRSEFEYLRAAAEHARAYNPTHPAANPRQAVDFNTVPITF